MSTISYSAVVTETKKRHKENIEGYSNSIGGVDFSSNSKIQLRPSESVTTSPTRLFSCSCNGVKILIHITVGNDTVSIPFSNWMLIPFEPDTDVTIRIENPADNDVSLPAEVSYFTV